jgi:hypothetical protein
LGNGKIILKWILQKLGERMWAAFNWLWILSSVRLLWR